MILRIIYVLQFVIILPFYLSAVVQPALPASKPTDSEGFSPILTIVIGISVVVVIVVPLVIVLVHGIKGGDKKRKASGITWFPKGFKTFTRNHSAGQVTNRVKEEQVDPNANQPDLWIDDPRPPKRFKVCVP